MLSNLFIQFLNGLTDASAMFLIAAGLSLIFGVSRIVNFAHGSFYMLGIYLAYAISEQIGQSAWGFWLGALASALMVAVFAGIIEILILRRIYHAPALFQLLATFALVLIIKDLCLFVWGPEDVFAARVPNLSGAINIFGHRFPEYDLVLIALGPIILALLWLLLHRTRWGKLIRAATQDREMVSALGVNQAWLFTSVFILGCFLAALGGALQSPRIPATLNLDLEVIASVFVIVVVGGMGSITGAFWAAILIAQVKAVLITIGQISLFGLVISVSKFTLVSEFVVMAIILLIRPWGLLGRPIQNTHAQRFSPEGFSALKPYMRYLCLAVIVLLMLLPVLAQAYPYLTILLIEIFIAILFAASLHFMMGPGGLHSFGHAAYFGIGAYSAALLMQHSALPMESLFIFAPLCAGLAALIFGWFCIRLSGIYLAMLTLAFAQIVWSIAYQWDDFTGGSNGLLGIWPAAWLNAPIVYYYFSLALCLGSLLIMRRILFSPYGLALRAGRDHEMRAYSIGVPVRQVQWISFIIAGSFCGLAGTLYVFSKGSISPEAISVTRSVDGLVMVLLGGMQSLLGPLSGAALFTWLQDTIVRETTYSHAVLGLSILALVLLLPGGLSAIFKRGAHRGIA